MGSKTITIFLSRADPLVCTTRYDELDGTPKRVPLEPVVWTERFIPVNRYSFGSNYSAREVGGIAGWTLCFKDSGGGCGSL